jgi:uncharacterized membrane protein YebE (DUF533 family)
MPSSSSLLESLLKSGQELLQQGRSATERGLNLPASEPQRSATMSGLKKGAIAGGILGLLLGTRAGRRLGGSALKLGTLAALGTVAYKAFQNWKSTASSGTSTARGHDWSPSQGGGFLHELKNGDVDERSQLLVRAMIAAAKADGHLDDTERTKIQQQIAELGLDQDAVELLQRELDQPVDARRVAQGVSSLPAAAEVYLASAMVIDVDQPSERRYLDELADAMGLDRGFSRKIEEEAVN